MSPSSHLVGAEAGDNVDGTVALLIRMLPRHTTLESLNAMLLFAKDFVGAHFLPADLQQDQGYASAVARFQSYPAAHEVKNLLNGKQKNPNEPPLCVEMIQYPSGGGLGNRGNKSGMAYNRVNSSSSTGSSNGQSRQPSRYNGTFQNVERISPPNGVSGFNNGASLSPTDGPPPSYFSPQSPAGQAMGDRQRVSGKDVIREDGIDDEPGDLLNDPVGFARNDSLGQLSRHPTNPQLPLGQFSNLSLNTNPATSPPLSGYTSPGSNMPLQSPISAMSPSNMGPNTPYQMATQYHPRSHYPPVNPADQNPPCNTLYVGNLPLNTSEDELKTIFSKQRGYKRLCFRTKTAGPMCFVEFEDITFATKALHELYGHCLHNSAKSGIRLSFSKNPLGVRNGQPGGMGPPTPLSPSGPMPGMNGLGITPFSTANGPPPGLTAPPGLNSPATEMNGMISPTTIGGPFGMDMSLGLRSGAISPYSCPRTNGIFGPQGSEGQVQQISDYYMYPRSIYPRYDERNGHNGQGGQNSQNAQNGRNSQSGHNGQNGQNNQESQNVKSGRNSQDGWNGQNGQIGLNNPNIQKQKGQNGKNGQNGYNGANGHYYDDTYRG